MSHTPVHYGPTPRAPNGALIVRAPLFRPREPTGPPFAEHTIEFRGRLWDAQRVLGVHMCEVEGARSAMSRERAFEEYATPEIVLRCTWPGLPPATDLRRTIPLVKSNRRPLTVYELAVEVVDAYKEYFDKLKRRQITPSEQPYGLKLNVAGRRCELMLVAIANTYENVWQAEVGWYPRT